MYKVMKWLNYFTPSQPLFRLVSLFLKYMKVKKRKGKKNKRLTYRPKKISSWKGNTNLFFRSILSKFDKAKCYYYLKYYYISKLARNFETQVACIFFLVMIFAEISTCWSMISSCRCSAELPLKFISLGPICFDLWPNLSIFFRKI